MQKIFTQLTAKKANFILCSILGAFILSMGLSSCKKNTAVVPPTFTAVSFVNSPGVGSYFVRSNNAPFLIPIGITTVSSSDRTIPVTITSKTAVAGTQYSTAPTSVTIKAGAYQDTIRFSGLFSGYPSTRKADTITVKLGGGYAFVNGQDTYQFTTQGYCDVVQANLIGAYTRTLDYYPATNGAPSASTYTCTIANWTPLTATTATVLLQNFNSTLDNGFGPFAPTDPGTTGLTATLNWTNPSSFTITIASQNFVAHLYTYGQSTISGSGTWSSCDQKFTITATVKVSAGSFSPETIVMLR